MKYAIAIIGLVWLTYSAMCAAFYTLRATLMYPLWDRLMHIGYEMGLKNLAYTVDGVLFDVALVLLVMGAPMYYFSARSIIKIVKEYKCE